MTGITNKKTTYIDKPYQDFVYIPKGTKVEIESELADGFIILNNGVRGVVKKEDLEVEE